MAVYQRYEAGDVPGAGAFLCAGCRATRTVRSADEELPFCSACGNSTWIQVREKETLRLFGSRRKT